MSQQAVPSANNKITMQYAVIKKQVPVCRVSHLHVFQISLHSCVIKEGKKVKVKIHQNFEIILCNLLSNTNGTM